MDFKDKLSRIRPARPKAADPVSPYQPWTDDRVEEMTEKQRRIAGIEALATIVPPPAPPRTEIHIVPPGIH